MAENLDSMASLVQQLVHQVESTWSHWSPDSSSTAWSNDHNMLGLVLGGDDEVCQQGLDRFYQQLNMPCCCFLFCVRLVLFMERLYQSWPIKKLGLEVYSWAYPKPESQSWYYQIVIFENQTKYIKISNIIKDLTCIQFVFKFHQSKTAALWSFCCFILFQYYRWSLSTCSRSSVQSSSERESVGWRSNVSILLQSYMLNIYDVYTKGNLLSLLSKIMLFLA